MLFTRNSLQIQLHKLKVKGLKKRQHHANINFLKSRYTQYTYTHTDTPRLGQSRPWSKENYWIKKDVTS